MKNDVLKRGIIIVLIILFFSCVISSIGATEEPTDILTLSKGGIVMSYPSDWGYSKATSNDSIMAISKLDSIDSSGIGQVNINIEKRPIEGDFNTYVNKTYKSMENDPSFELVSSGEVIIGDKNAFECIYISKNGTDEREHKAVWFEKGGQAYVIMYSAPVDQFESNLYVFDYVLSELQFA